jgi:hypothetical protein
MLSGNRKTVGSDQCRQAVTSVTFGLVEKIRRGVVRGEVGRGVGHRAAGWLSNHCSRKNRRPVVLRCDVLLQIPEY